MTPITALLAAAAGVVTPVEAPDQRYGALFNDMELNAMIDNGNEVITTRWLYGYDRDKPPEVEITNLTCAIDGASQLCRFEVSRKPNSDSTAKEDRAEPAMLACEAKLAQRGDGTWFVTHWRERPNQIHTSTTLVCAVRP